ncbi:AMP-dependent synthetase/ligase [Nocardioides daejeonensis]|uniref:AMP-dependent synthetase/ligase n=1 Tax=Nocardioides daejeonensis TaxID=1046556 RepID=UPI000D74B97C|nr:AMP-binding protein [Nocardioides daejeonensis]
MKIAMSPHTAPFRASAVSLPGRLLQLAGGMPTEPAIRNKELGIYVESTWRQYADQVAQCAAALAALGVRRTEVVAILADNGIEWVVADLATQGLGAVACGIYPTNSAEEVAYILEHSRAKVVVVGDQEQADKVIEVRARVPHLEHVVIVDPRGTRNYSEDLIHWSDLMAQGHGTPIDFAASVRGVAADDPAVLIYTSGTTGNPKGAILSHANLSVGADRLVDGLGARREDNILSYLPLCHLAEKVFTELLPLTVGNCVHFGESIDTVQSDLVEVAPTVFLGVPRIWEKMQARVDMGLRRSTRLKNWVHAKALAQGYRILARHEERRYLLRDRIQRFFLDVFVHRALRKRLGLERVRAAICGGASVSPEVLRWFYAIGISIREIYGLTEAGVTHVVPLDARVRIGEVGPEMTGVECRLGDDGEVMLRSQTTFLGYLHDDAATAAMVDDQGWLGSGDIGHIDEHGWLSIVGRKKQIIITSGGKNLSPEAIENALKDSPYIAEAVALGDNRNYVAALIQVDWDATSDWAASQKIAATSFADLAGKTEVRTLIQREIDAANQRLARVEQVRGFALLTKQLHQDDGELTPTQKVKRRAVMEIYHEQIDAIYAKGGRR